MQSTSSFVDIATTLININNIDYYFKINDINEAQFIINKTIIQLNNRGITNINKKLLNEILNSLNNIRININNTSKINEFIYNLKNTLQNNLKYFV